jgi:hypothetical protein
MLKIQGKVPFSPLPTPLKKQFIFVRDVIFSVYLAGEILFENLKLYLSPPENRNNPSL